MSELELRLQALGSRLAFPESPDLAAAVSARIAQPERRPFWSRRLIAVAVAVLAVAVGAVFAVPPARTAILDWLGIGSAEIRIVEELPEVETVPLYLGERASIEEARRLVPGLLEPRLEGLDEPDGVFVRTLEPGAPVSFLWGTTAKPRLLLTQVRGRFSFEKAVAVGSGVVVTEVNGERAAWIEGAEHAVFFQTDEGADGILESRLARNTLVWSRGPVTLRLEGDLSREDAERIARSVRP